MDLSIFGLQATLAMLLLEGLKQLLYKIVPTFNLNPNWYVLILPVLSLGVLPVASWLSGGALDFTLWTSDVVRQTILTILAALVSTLEYNTTLKPFKASLVDFDALKK